MERIIKSTFFQKDPVTLAKSLLGKTLVVNDKSLIITEVESYLGTNDLASHSRFGKSKRSSILYHEGGTIYIYLIYGLHYCTNIVAGKYNEPGAVLLRSGIDERGEKVYGPGRFSKYLGIDKLFNGEDIKTSSKIYLKESLILIKDIKSGKRIGVNYALEWAEKPLRFWIELI